MINFKTISSYCTRLAALLKVKRKVYANVEVEIRREFAGKPIEQIRQNNDMILLEGDLVVIKLRSNNEDRNHIPVVCLSERKYALTRDDKFTEDLKNFPGFKVLVCSKPQDMPYNV